MKELKPAGMTSRCSLVGLEYCDVAGYTSARNRDMPVVYVVL
jgi:hypothetical protein